MSKGNTQQTVEYALKRKFLSESNFRMVIAKAVVQHKLAEEKKLVYSSKEATKSCSFSKLFKIYDINNDQSVVYEHP